MDCAAIQLDMPAFNHRLNRCVRITNVVHVATAGDRPRGYSLLHVAAGAGQPAAAQWLLERGAAIDGAPESAFALHLPCALSA